LDSSVSPLVKTELEKLGHDITSVRDWKADPGDKVILEKAFNEDRIVITLDKDFGELAIVQGHPHAGILRLTNASRQTQINLAV
jgi:predicted nuclease of predicted toxin-antitoxin system